MAGAQSAAFAYRMHTVRVVFAASAMHALAGRG